MWKPVGPLWTTPYPRRRFPTGPSPGVSQADVRPQTHCMPRWRDDRVQEIRQQLTPQDDGSLWILYLEDPYGEALLASAVTDAMAQMDRQMTENLGMIITSVAPKAVLLVVPRRDGKPLAVDSQLWSDLQDLLSGSTTELTDLLVVGRSRCWSARDSLA